MANFNRLLVSGYILCLLTNREAIMKVNLALDGKKRVEFMSKHK